MADVTVIKHLEICIIVSNAYYLIRQHLYHNIFEIHGAAGVMSLQGKRAA